MSQPSRSEDIQSLDDRVAKYLRFQHEIRMAISINESGGDALVDDVVDAICKLINSPTWQDIITLGITAAKKYLKRRKLRKVVEIILHKLFDITLGWYVMDYEDLKETCDFVGGKDYFSREEHRAIYTAVVQKLRAGPIRDKCIELGIVGFVNEKSVDVKNNFLEFKAREL
jgi:hypothetical protein